MKYRYSARDDKRILHSGVIEAETSKLVVSVLQERKLIPIKIIPLQGLQDLGSSLNYFRKVSSIEVANFTRQLATMMTAGLPITDGLNLLELQSSPAFSPIVGAILDDVQAGVSLSESLSRHPQIFSRVYVALVKAGESAGVLETILQRLADSLEKSREFQGRIKGALIYPLIVIIGMFIVMVIMMTVVIPKLTLIYGEFGAKLPLATRLIVGISDFSVHFWWLVILLVGGSLYGAWLYINHPTGRQKWDSYQYKIPVVGKLLQQVMLTELTRTLSLLIGTGVSVVEALNIVAGALGNSVVETEIIRISKKVERGFPLSISISESPLFPIMLGQMVAVGEETGKMDEVLTKLSHFYETESDQQVKTLTTAIEPMIIIVLGVGVGFLMFAVIMPIYGITNQF